VAGVSDITVEYNTDTARTIISMIDSGRAIECSDAKFIYSHAGGTILALPGRFLGQQATRASLAKQADPKSRLGQLRRFYYDTAGSTNPIQMTALRQLIGMSQIVFGTDFPFGRSANIAAGLEGVRRVQRRGAAGHRSRQHAPACAQIRVNADHP